jgi:hypothetical protein
MTLPYERFRAVKSAREFLGDLLDPRKTPRVPKDVRRQALFVLRHYPMDYEMEHVADLVPELFSRKLK